MKTTYCTMISVYYIINTKYGITNMKTLTGCCIQNLKYNIMFFSETACIIALITVTKLEVQQCTTHVVIAIHCMPQHKIYQWDVFFWVLTNVHPSTFFSLPSIFNWALFLHNMKREKKTITQLVVRFSILIFSSNNYLAGFLCFLSWFLLRSTSSGQSCVAVLLKSLTVFALWSL